MPAAKLAHNGSLYPTSLYTFLAGVKQNSPQNLASAFREVARHEGAPGVDHVTIDHDILMERIEDHVSDCRLLELLRARFKQGILDEGCIVVPEAGSPQGSTLSPLLSNIYLNPLDHLLARAGFEMIRYADDFVVLRRSVEEAQASLELIREWTASARLTLHPMKTKVVTLEDDFDFPGYHFERGYRWPRSKSLQKLKDRLRAETKRTNGTSLQTIIADD